jgi:hypothetical protein
MAVDEVALMATAMGYAVFTDTGHYPIHIQCNRCGLYLVYYDPVKVPAWQVWDMTKTPHYWRGALIADVIDRLENPP